MVSRNQTAIKLSDKEREIADEIAAIEGFSSMAEAIRYSLRYTFQALKGKQGEAS